MDLNEKQLSSLHRLTFTRRRLLQGAGLTAAAFAVTGASGLSLPMAHATTTQALTDIDIANYALTLEHLEAEFYTEVVAGGQLSGTALAVLTVIRDHENAHVAALTALITKFGGTPVQKQDKYNFGDLSTQAKILATAQVLEDTGVGAYTGQAALIADKVNVLPAAASIEQVEARHYAAISYLLGVDGAPAAFGPNYTMEQVLAKVKPILGN